MALRLDHAKYYRLNRTRSSDATAPPLPMVAGLGRRWTQIWFADIPTTTFAVFRTGLGLVCLVWFITLLPDLEAFFGQQGVTLAPEYPPGRFGLFRWLVADYWVWIGAVSGAVASALMVVGRLTRFVGPLVAILVTSFMVDSQWIWNAGDSVLQTFTMLFAAYCILTPSALLNVSLRTAATDDSRRRHATGPIWLFRLIQIQLTIIYAATFLAKIDGEPWRTGEATLQVFRLETLGRFYVPELFKTNLLVSNAMTWGVLVIEGLLPILLWNRRSRPYAIGAGVLLHLAIDWSMNVGIFSWIMIVGYASFADPSWARTIVSRYRPG